MPNTTVVSDFCPSLKEAALRSCTAYLSVKNITANPQGAVAEPSYFGRLAALARRFGFLLFSDECYSEIYTRQAPASVIKCPARFPLSTVETYFGSSGRRPRVSYQL